MKFLILPFLLFCSYLFSADSQVDFRIDVDPSNPQHKTSFNFNTSTAIEWENHAILFSPDMTFYPNGGIDFSIAYAHRHKLFGMVVGHQIFFDRSNAGFYSLDQVGTGIDVLTQRFDFRMNYYHPVASRQITQITACKWVDSEILFKTQHFGVGTGPLYNIDMKSWALHSRLIIPMKNVSVNIGALCGQAGLSQAIVSFSFHLFPKESNTIITSPCHVQKSNIYYNSGYDLDIFGVDPSNGARAIQNYKPPVVSYIEQSEDKVTFWGIPRP